jgi:hypothetical protein
MSASTETPTENQDIFRDLLCNGATAHRYPLPSNIIEHRSQFPFLTLPGGMVEKHNVDDPVDPNNTEAVMPFSGNPQGESSFPFTKLPAEIRNMIYFLLLAGRTIMLNIPYSSPVRYFAVRSGRFLPAVLAEHPQPEICHIDGSSFLRQDSLTIGLLGTSRQIYNETCAIPYISNTFSIHAGLLPLWLNRRMYTQLQVIRSLKLTGHMYSTTDNYSFLSAMTEAAGFLTGLRELDITMVVNTKMAIRGEGAGWLMAVEVLLGGNLEGHVEVNPVSGPAGWRWRVFGGEEAVRRLNEKFGG